MTRVPLNPTFLLLALAIVAASALALWWLLRREARTTLLVLALLTSLGLAARLAYTTDYPTGLNEDEPKVLYAAGRAVEQGTALAESNISVPILPHALFQGQLIPLLGVSSRWAVRGYSFVAGVLCAPAAFAAARALQLSATASLAGAGLVAVLPWSLFYSRVMTGNELTFFQLLLLAALGRLVFLGARAARPPLGRDTPPAATTALARASAARAAGAPPALLGAGWREWALGSFALAWLLYAYWPTRSMLPMVFVAAGLATGLRRRLWCVAIAATALLLYAPYIVANRNSVFITQGVNLGSFAGLANPIGLARRLLDTLAAFVWPRAEDGWLTIRSAAMHPFWLLPVAGLGVLAPTRRALFLAAGFLLGLAPTLLAWGPPSTHRMLMAYPFVALAAGSALDRVGAPRLRRAASVALVVLAGWWSVRLYFSDAFWPQPSRWVFDWQRTELIESLPPPDGLPVVFLRQISYFRDPRRLLVGRDTELAVNNWFPSNSGAVYAFTWEALPLRSFYERLVGPGRVRAFGAAFTVTLEPGEWSWLRRHGWSYTAECPPQTRRAQVPALFHPNLSFSFMTCEHPSRHTWQGRWDGPETALRLRARGAASVDAGARRFESTLVGAESIVDFSAAPGMDIAVSVTAPPLQPWVFAELFELTPGGERVPVWERVTPRTEALATEP
jgi:hypothetical protein